MIRTIICGDLHIDERSIPEIDSIFSNDILSIESDRFIQLGDWFQSNRPTPLELTYSTQLVLKLKQHYKEIVILSGTGEHDLLHNESVISHLASLGVKTIKGDYIDNTILYGHFMVNESRFAFGTARCGLKDLEKYQYVFLGHQHSPQDLTTTIFHVGSIRYCSFNEVEDRKQIMILQDGLIANIELKSLIPMLDVTDVTKLEQLEPRNKVRVIFNSFEDYKKNASYVNKLGKKFFQFKILTNFKESNILVQSSNRLDIKINKSNIISSYLDNIKDIEVRNLLKEQFKENI